MATPERIQDFAEADSVVAASDAEWSTKHSMGECTMTERAQAGVRVRDEVVRAMFRAHYIDTTCAACSGPLDDPRGFATWGDACGRGTQSLKLAVAGMTCKRCGGRHWLLNDQFAAWGTPMVHTGWHGPADVVDFVAGHPRQVYFYCTVLDGSDGTRVREYHGWQDADTRKITQSG